MVYRNNPDYDNCMLERVKKGTSRRIEKCKKTSYARKDVTLLSPHNEECCSWICASTLFK